MVPVKELRSDLWSPSIIPVADWTPRVVKYSEDEERNDHGEWTSGSESDAVYEVFQKGSDVKVGDTVLYGRYGAVKVDTIDVHPKNPAYMRVSGTTVPEGKRIKFDLSGRKQYPTYVTRANVLQKPISDDRAKFLAKLYVGVFRHDPGHADDVGGNVPHRERVMFEGELNARLNGSHLQADSSITNYGKYHSVMKEDAIRARENADDFMRAITERARPSTGNLYRGLVFTEEQLAGLTVGKVVDIPISSWTTLEGGAQNYAYPSSIRAGVILVAPSGTMGASMEDMNNKNPAFPQILSGGRYEITGVHEKIVGASFPRSYTYVDVKQIEFHAKVAKPNWRQTDPNFWPSWFPDNFDPDPAFADQQVGAAKLLKSLTKYSEDEKRDAHGEWTSGGEGEKVPMEDWITWAYESQQINDSMRGETPAYGSQGATATPEMLDDWKRIGAAIQHEASTTRLPYTEVWRGDSFQTEQELFDRYGNGKPNGGRVRSTGLISTSPSRDVADQYRTEMENPITATITYMNPNGMIGAVADPLAVAAGGPIDFEAAKNAEVVLPAGQTWNTNIYAPGEQTPYGTFDHWFVSAYSARKLGKLLASAILKYSEDEERNAHGEWTSGGGDEKEAAPHLDDASRTVLASAGVPIASDGAWDNLARSMSTGEPLDAKSNDEIAAQMNAIMSAPERGISWTTQGGFTDAGRWANEEDKAALLAPYTVGTKPLEKDRYTYGSPHLQMLFRNDVNARTNAYPSESGLARAAEVEKNPIYRQMELASRYTMRGGLTANDYATGRLPLTMSGGLAEGSLRTQNLVKDQRANLSNEENIRAPVAGAPYWKTGSQMLTSDELKSVREQMAQAVAGRSASIQVNDNVIGKVARGETIGNLFTANKTNAAAGAGTYYFDVRRGSEGNIMGVPYNAGGDVRPVYGYLDDKQQSHDFYTPGEVRLALMAEHEHMHGVSPGISEEEAIAASRAYWDKEAASVREKGVTKYEKDPEAKAAWYIANTDRQLAEVNDVMKHPGNYVVTLTRERGEHGDLYDSIQIQTRTELDAQVSKYADKSYLTRDDKQAIRALASTKVWPVAGADGKINSTLISYMMSRDAGLGFTQYGTTKVTMKPDFMSSSKSTITFGDSLDSHPRVALPYDAVKNADSRLVVAGNESFIDRNNDSSPKVVGAGYVETQMMRHPGLDDIKSVIFHGQAPAPSVVSKLNAAGIETNVVYPGLRLKDGQSSLKDRLPLNRL